MTHKTLFNRLSSEIDDKQLMNEQQFKKAFMLIREHTIREVVRECKVEGVIRIDAESDLLLTQELLELCFKLKEYE